MAAAGEGEVTDQRGRVAVNRTEHKVLALFPFAGTETSQRMCRMGSSKEAPTIQQPFQDKAPKLEMRVYTTWARLAVKPKPGVWLRGVAWL